MILDAFPRLPQRCPGKIIGIRPKIYLANDGNYREMRWFTPWYIDPSKQGQQSTEILPLLPLRVKYDAHHLDPTLGWLIGGTRGKMKCLPSLPRDAAVYQHVEDPGAKH